MFVGMCGVSETSKWHTRQASGTTFPHISLFTEGDDSDKTVPARFLSDGHLFGIFVPLPPAVMIGFTQIANISLEAGFG